MHNLLMHNEFMSDLKEMGKRLRFARVLAGYSTAASAAEVLRIDYPTYASHENGSRGFFKRGARYAKFYNVDYTWLMQGIGRPRTGTAYPNQASPTMPVERSEEQIIREFLEFQRNKKT